MEQKRSKSDFVSIEVLVFTSRNGDIVPRLEGKGFVPTTPSGEKELFDLAARKFFIAIVLDLDLPRKRAGFRILSRLRRLSPLSHFYLVAEEPAPEDVAAAYRMGIKDFYIMKDMWASSLVVKVVEDAREVTHKELMSKTLKELWEVEGETLSSLYDLHARLMDVQFREAYGSDGIPPEEGLPPASLLAVVTSEDLQRMVAEAFPVEKGWMVEMVPTGGEGLDLGTSRTFDGYIIEEELPDMLGSMVLTSIAASDSAPAVLARGGGSFVKPDGGESSLEQFRDTMLEIRKSRWGDERTRRINEAFRSQYLNILMRTKHIGERLVRLGIVEK